MRHGYTEPGLNIKVLLKDTKRKCKKRSVGSSSTAAANVHTVLFTVDRLQLPTPPSRFAQIKRDRLCLSLNTPNVKTNVDSGGTWCGQRPRLQLGASTTPAPRAVDTFSLLDTPLGHQHEVTSVYCPRPTSQISPTKVCMCTSTCTVCQLEPRSRLITCLSRCRKKRGPPGCPHTK